MILKINHFKIAFYSLFVCSFLFSCVKEDPIKAEPKLIIKLIVDPDQERLGSVGNPSTIPAGNASQTPVFNSIGAHYIEFAPTAITPLGKGSIIYHAPETTLGGTNAIEFKKSIIKGSDEVYLEIPLKSLTAGSYEWVRLSLSYQNFDLQFYYSGQSFTGTLASFVGFNTYIADYKVKNQTVAVNANKLQGYWGFEAISKVLTGQAPAGATTVPNPIFVTSPIPAGSCGVTGKFANNLIITGQEAKDVTIRMSLSVNKSFEWKDINGNGKWDVDVTGENVVDMGLRGLIPIVEQ